MPSAAAASKLLNVPCKLLLLLLVSAIAADTSGGPSKLHSCAAMRSAHCWLLGSALTSPLLLLLLLVVAVSASAVSAAA